MTRKKSRTSGCKTWPRVGWVLFGLLALAGRASAGAWSLENPVLVMDGGSLIGTAVPVSYQEVEDTLAWLAPIPIE